MWRLHLFYGIERLRFAFVFSTELIEGVVCPVVNVFRVRNFAAQFFCNIRASPYEFENG